MLSPACKKLQLLHQVLKLNSIEFQSLVYSFSVHTKSAFAASMKPPWVAVLNTVRFFRCEMFQNDGSSPDEILHDSYTYKYFMMYQHL